MYHITVNDKYLDIMLKSKIVNEKIQKLLIISLIKLLDLNDIKIILDKLNEYLISLKYLISFLFPTA